MEASFTRISHNLFKKKNLLNLVFRAHMRVATRLYVAAIYGVKFVVKPLSLFLSLTHSLFLSLPRCRTHEAQLCALK
jgi:hypothetical protein